MNLEKSNCIVGYCFYNAFYRMSWSRAVWIEGMKTVEGVLPSLWISGTLVRWPRKNDRTAMKQMATPSDDWKVFKLIKVKFSSGKYIYMMCL